MGAALTRVRDAYATSPWIRSGIGGGPIRARTRRSVGGDRNRAGDCVILSAAKNSGIFALILFRDSSLLTRLADSFSRSTFGFAGVADSVQNDSTGWCSGLVTRLGQVLLVMPEDTFPSVVVALLSFGRLGVLLPSSVLELD
jgi:hypothetical protein